MSLEGLGVKYIASQKIQTCPNIIHTSQAFLCFVGKYEPCVCYILARSTTNWDVAVEILGPVWNDGTANSYSVKFPKF